jgi:hypothetical protein
MEWGLSSNGEEKNVLPETLSWQGLNKYVIPNYTGGLKISSALVDLTWLKVLSVVFVTLATQTPIALRSMNFAKLPIATPAEITLDTFTLSFLDGSVRLTVRTLHHSSIMQRPLVIYFFKSGTDELLTW